MPLAASRARVSALVTASSALALSACSDSQGPSESLQSQLEAARSRWEASGVTEYAVTELRSCECPEPTGWTVVVSAGQPSFIDSVEPVSGTSLGARELESQALDLSMSVEQLFDWIGQQIGNVDALDVTFDADLGYPTSIRVDPSADVTDDEVSWLLSDVVPTTNCGGYICQEALRVVLHAPNAGFVPGDYVLTVTPSGGAASSCSFSFDADLSCGSTICPVRVTCPLSFPAVREFILMLPFVEGPVDVTVDKDGSPFASTSAIAALVRAQPNGPLCGPVCWQTQVDVQLP